MTDISRWCVAAALTFSASVPAARAQYLISTYAGGLPAPTATVATAYPIQIPTALATDRYGNTYIGTNASCVFRLDASGKLSRVAGTCQTGFSGDGGSAVNAQLNNPEGLAIDVFGNLYISDDGNQRIRRVTPEGIISTFAGNGSAGFGGDSGQATGAQLNNPKGIAVDTSGNLYIADQLNHRIRQVSANGIITTIAGSNTSGNAGDGGPATAANLEFPLGLALDTSGNLYVGDSGSNSVRKIVPGGIITLVAGTGAYGYTGDSGPAIVATLNGPAAVACDSAGNVYIADQGNFAVREVKLSGMISTYAGGNGFGSTGDNGPALQAQLLGPGALAFDSAGDLYIGDQAPGYPTSRVRMVSAGGAITTVAGNSALPFGGDGGPAGLAQLASPWGIARDGFGNVYVVDWKNYRVREITPGGTISTFAGNGTASDTGDNGSATSAGVTPYAVVADPSGNVYTADQAIVRKVSGGTITTVAGNGTANYSGDNGPAIDATLSAHLTGIAMDSKQNLYVADYDNQRIRKITPGPNSIITTVAGDGTRGYNGDGIPAIGAKLNDPSSVAVDKNGNLYIADSQNNRIRVVTADGNISTYAGTGAVANNGDGGLATSAAVLNPSGLAFDAAGTTLFIATGGNTIRMVSPSGVISTVAGTGVAGYSGDGGAATAAQLANPFGLATDSNGNVYVSDQFNSAIRVLQPAGSEPLLSITSEHAGAFTSGDSGSYTLTVSNAASAGNTGGTATVTEVLPAGLTMSGMSGSGWTCSDSSPPYTCQSSGSIGPNGSYPQITVDVSVGSGAVPQVTNSAAVTGGGSLGAASEDVTVVTGSAAALGISLTHGGNFFTGAKGVYTITVANQPSAAATSGAVTVTDTLPAGLSIVSISGGNNWNCSNNSVSCTRSDSLMGGAGYDPIAVTVSVSKNAPSSVVNQATVTWNVSLTATATDTTTIVSNACDVTGDATVSVTDVQEMVNETLGTRQAAHDLNHDGAVNVIDVQIVINDALGLNCSL
jgi:uncharacterized repeat protein (TIGR01451 family)